MLVPKMSWGLGVSFFKQCEAMDGSEVNETVMGLVRMARMIMVERYAWLQLASRCWAMVCS